MKQTTITEDEIMTRERVLIAMARLRHGDDLAPVCKRPTLEDCITTEDDGKQILWYNTLDNSTHIVTL